MKVATQKAEAGPPAVNDESWLELVRRQVGSLEYGVVQIVVHAARVVQVERTEKVRFTKPIAVSNGPV